MCEELQLEIIRDIDRLISLSHEWDALDAIHSFRIPFTSACWNILWWQHLRSTSLLRRNELHTFALRNTSGELVAIAPMSISILPGMGMFDIRILQFLGADPNLTEVRGLLCRPEYADQAMAAIQIYLAQHKQQWDWVEWPNLTQSQADQHASFDTLACSPRPMYYLPLPATWDTLKAGLSRNMKEALRKCTNSLKRANITHDFRIISSAEETPFALQTFFRLHALRSKINNTVPHANAFSEDKSQQFLSAYAQAMAAKNCLRIFQIVINDEVVATRIGLICGRHLYLYYSGYDIAWGRYSIMTKLVVRTIQWAIAQSFECVNLSTGNDYSKLRWQPQVLWTYSAVQLSPRLRAAPLFRIYKQLRGYKIAHRLSHST
ncbi:GNAT family N-acetyltransferase [Herbaspirillum sp. RTI4]|uniref:GNAT family N-acetyltransferase n=1 Tax=Herbaspirillum sp. RTI4 TaxID=3048640 RepID=UPI002AB5048B|nr:GNAT family N-acetyltransferase [Herbaspirillum sp. RTI4]MDY7578557.1 GNAT family N-acetyltransferase [Herbaspirillum sp. RTI4]MEA9981137.1 GNAT family N-acetyltransferase [Herbaspirillum sp. RTI4]